MKSALNFSQLSTSRKALVRLCQTIAFGSILDLRIVDGDVIFDPPPVVLVDIRLDEEISGRLESELTDFSLCTEVRRLLTAIDTIESGTIDKIVVHAGIPRRMTFQRPLSKVVHIRTLRTGGST
jgi:hypothetical protein